MWCCPARPAGIRRLGYPFAFLNVSYYREGCQHLVTFCGLRQCVRLATRLPPLLHPPRPPFPGLLHQPLRYPLTLFKPLIPFVRLRSALLVFANLTQTFSFPVPLCTHGPPALPSMAHSLFIIHRITIDPPVFTCQKSSWRKFDVCRSHAFIAFSRWFRIPIFSLSTYCIRITIIVWFIILTPEAPLPSRDPCQRRILRRFPPDRL
jgi:hypothetical protein